MNGNVNTEKYLPLGTVVLLKGGKKRIMVTGFCMLISSEDNKMYDYCGCPYPEGVVKADKIAVFNHDQIEKIYYMGLRDEEELKFKENLVKLIEFQQALSSDDETNE